MAEENTTDKGKNPAQGATTDGNATCVPHEPFPTIQQLQQLQQAGVSTEDFQKWIEDKAARAQQSSTPLPTQIASATTGKASLETPTKAAKRGKATEESPAVSSAEKRHSNPKRAKTAKGRSRKLKAELEALISEHPPISEYVSFHWYFNRRLEDFDPPQIIIDELARSAPDTSQSNHTIWKSLVKPLGEIQKHVQGPNQNRWDQVWGTTVKMPRLPTSTQLQALRYLDQKKGPVIGDALLARFKNADLLWFANGGPPTEFWRGAMLDDPTWRLEYMEKGENTPSSAIDTSGLIDLMKEVFPSRPAGLKMLNVAEDAGSDLDNPFTDKLRGAMAIGLSKTLAKVTKMEQTIEQLRVQVDLKRSLLVTANERIEEMEQTIEQLRVQVDSKTSLLVTANEEIEKMEQTIKQLESKAGDNMKERWSVVEDQVAELKEQAKSERVARERLEAGLKTLRQQLEKRGLSPVDE
ncbi:hypothetical protein C8A00DRAFT_35043 [Chaetomidium leptoderma]|uniref:Uncharacterized protein n=1 Tax=Chaetomidium leptoderma TaxID=669021 RepID=A0AAN6ZUE5_9PEZI|nr:hypothetical protein C8A00DRAFT_35043 [Chaetomidium leptoderma]